jgi:hypothetical protein
MNITVNAHTVKHMHSVVLHAVAAKHAAVAAKMAAKAKMWPDRVLGEAEGL